MGKEKETKQAVGHLGRGTLARLRVAEMCAQLGCFLVKVLVLLNPTFI